MAAHHGRNLRKTRVSARVLQTLKGLTANIFKISLITTLFKKGLTENIFKISLITTLFKKGLTENGVTFGFESLIPKPYPA